MADYYRTRAKEVRMIKKAEEPAPADPAPAGAASAGPAPASPDPKAQ
jgi:hypothetical protein